ncbi:hypothetical protein M7I_2885 [Glarea lozoyensis 74030]|uniref:Uncharacterized protein n=1 Tax=Glarea lozoyensis (strain ATCC 74030 / MF5533) TaxID=1104152 RepID=H0EK01_GLAL7|nr:hypothetical protein M7I_2885 [Glarea lozoyensis 74030]
MAIRPDTLAAIPLCLIVALGTRFEIFLIASIALYFNWQDGAKLIETYVGFTYLTTVFGIGFVVLGLIQFLRYINTLKSWNLEQNEFPAKPLFFTCETSHTRFFPQKNSFKYSYLLTGIPVGWKGNSGGMISADVETDETPWYSKLLSHKPFGAWWTVRGDNYMARGSAMNGLRGKLDQYLESENLDPKDYPYAYLFTAAKFLGYSSNPVSFWNLYSESKELKAMIYEVNNTFDERHNYLLIPEASQPRETKTSKTATQPISTRHQVKFSKELFVSPFNYRNEGYSASANDCLYPEMNGKGPFDTTITLSSAEGQPKVIARIYSTGKAIDPSVLSVWERTRFIYSWWGIGFLTVPRTLWQAYILSRRRKLPFAFAPQPKESNIGRTAQEDEIAYEKLFLGYLRIHTVEEIVIYSPAAQELLWNNPEKRDEVAQLEIKVLSPTLYSRLLHYGFCSIGHILLSESQLLNQTIKISDTQILSSVFGSACPPQKATLASTWQLPWYERTTLDLLSALTDSKKPAPYISSIERKECDQESTNKQLHHAHHIKANTEGSAPITLHEYLATTDAALRRTFLINAMKLALAPGSAPEIVFVMMYL